MNTIRQRIAINLGGGFVPGLETVVTGAVLAAGELGWEVVGIRDGFEGLLFPERYPGGGLVSLDRQAVEEPSGPAASWLGTAARVDPFRVQVLSADNQVEEVDRSDELLNMLRSEEISAVVSVVNPRALSILFRLHRKGLRAVCIPKSAENDVVSTSLSFGYNTALGNATRLLDNAREAARSARKLGVVEVLGERSGWLALQAGMAVCADAVLTPEIPYDLEKVAARLQERAAPRGYGLVVVAAGARPAHGDAFAEAPARGSLRASLSPLATGRDGDSIIESSGRAAREVALELQRRTGLETYPLALGELIKAGPPTAVDRQLGLGYGAAAIRALQEEQSGVMVCFQPPDLAFVPLAEAINKIRTVPPGSVFVQIARSLGMSLGD